MCARVGASDSHGFVEVAEKALDTDGFVVTPGSWVETHAKEFTGFGENAAKGDASVDNDKSAHTHFQKDLLEQESSEFVGMNVCDRDAHDKLG